MKFFWLLAIPAIALLVILSSAKACPKGDSEWEGACVVDIQPESAPADTVKPSDEKPPKDKMPSYEREGIKIIDVPPGVDHSSVAAQDYQAESSQGKAP
jgi:hypothetical protein